MEKSTTNPKVPSDETLQVEYAAAQDDYIHNDSFPWQIGSILIAGTFVFWGLLLDRTPDARTLGITSLLVTLLMSIWILYVHHFRQTYLCKLDRMKEIEARLGMESHSRWDSGTYKRFGPRGHNMDLAIFWVASFGAPLIGLLKDLKSYWLASPLPIVLFVTVWVIVNECRIQALLKANKTNRANQVLQPTRAEGEA
jgi:hypothetical protein